MRKLFYSIAVAAIAATAFSSLSLLGSCGSKGAGDTEKAEETEAEIEAAMMEGRESAKIFINRKWADTTELQKNILEARSRRARYDTVDKPKCSAAYDSAFVSTIRTVSPDVAAQIK